MISPGTLMTCRVHDDGERSRSSCMSLGAVFLAGYRRQVASPVSADDALHGDVVRDVASSWETETFAPSALLSPVRSLPLTGIAQERDPAGL